MSAFVAVFERMIDTLEESGETQLVDRAQEEWHMERKEREELQARVIASLSPPTGKVLVDVEKLRRLRDSITETPPTGMSAAGFFCSLVDETIGFIDVLLKENHVS